MLRRLRDGAVVGYTLLEANRRHRTFYNNTTCVLPECRGLGLGRVFYALKRRALDIPGYDSMTCHVAVDNRASIGLFENAGFQIINVIPAYYDDGRDAYRMRLRLRP